MRKVGDCIGQRLRRQSTYVGQRRHCGASEAIFQQLAANPNIAIERKCSEELVHIDRRILRPDLDDIASTPIHRRIAAGQRHMEYRPPNAAGIQQYTFGQFPVRVRRRFPIGQIDRTRQRTDLVLPVSQGGRVAVVDLDHVEQWQGALFA